jgi:hypothetical protein
MEKRARVAPSVDRGVVDFSLGMERRICEFGFPGPLRDPLVGAVLSGVKTATSSLLADWQRDGEQPPAAGELQTVIDWTGTPVAVIEILGCEVVALGAVDDRVARAEGSPIRQRLAGGLRTSGSGARRSSLPGRGTYRPSTTQPLSLWSGSVFGSESDFRSPRPSGHELLAFRRVRRRRRCRRESR